MLIEEKFFKVFIPGKDISDAKTTTEVLLALSLNSREEVDLMIKKVQQQGGKEYRTAQDHGWMYARSFQDPDGHIWEAFYADEKKLPEEMKKRK